MATDAIVLLKQDHKEIKKVFRDFHAAGPNATTTKADLVAKMIELLTVHTYLENEIMYPEVRRLLPDLADLGERAVGVPHRVDDEAVVGLVEIDSQVAG